MINVNQITSQLAQMPDQALQRYAMLNKNDPYTVSLALSESNRRKAMRAGAAPMPGQQPKVVDQDIAEMATPVQPMAQQLPENVGIGQLPAPNMQRMADGGIVGYAEGGEVPGYAGGVQVQDFITKYAQQYNVDPALLAQITKVEAGAQGATAKNPKSSAHGLGQLVDKMWHKVGGGDRSDPETQVRNAAVLLRKNNDSFAKAMGREPNPTESYTTWVLGDSAGRAVLKADPSTPIQDVLNKVYPNQEKRVANIVRDNKFENKPAGEIVNWAQNKMLPVTSAVAAQAAPASTPQDIVSRIPTGGVPGAGPTAPGPDTRSYFGRLADELGISEETQRNINNSLSALGGWTAPASRVGRGVGLASKGLEATPEMLAKAEQLKNASALPRLAPPVAKGIETLAPEAQATRAAAEEARRMRQMTEDVNAAKAAEQSIKAADLTANTALNTEKALAAQQEARALDSAKLANVGRATTGMQAVDAIESKPGITGLPMGDLGYDTSGLDALNKKDKEELISVGKTAVPAGKGKDFSNDMLLMLGLNMMAGQSPNFLTNVGQAGISALKYGQEAKKEASEQAYREALAKHYGVPSEVQMLEYLKDPANMAAYMKQREAMGDPALMKELVTEYIKNPAGLTILQQQNPAIYNMVKQQAMRALAPNPMSAVPGAGATMRPPV